MSLTPPKTKGTRTRAPRLKRPAAAASAHKKRLVKKYPELSPESRKKQVHRDASKRWHDRFVSKGVPKQAKGTENHKTEAAPASKRKTNGKTNGKTNAAPASPKMSEALCLKLSNVIYRYL